MCTECEFSAKSGKFHTLDVFLVWNSLRRLEHDSLWFLSSFEIDRPAMVTIAFYVGPVCNWGAFYAFIPFDVGSPLQDAHGKTFTAVSGRRLFRIAWKTFNQLVREKHLRGVLVNAFAVLCDCELTVALTL